MERGCQKKKKLGRLAIAKRMGWAKRMRSVVWCGLVWRREVGIIVCDSSRGRVGVGAGR